MPLLTPTRVQSTLLIVLIVFLVTGSHAKSSQSRRSKCHKLQHNLLTDMFEDYDRDAHPGGGMSVKVLFGAKLARLVKVEEINNVIKAQWWMKQSWYNPDMRWNQSEYGNVSIVFVEPTRVWVPDILLYNSGDEKSDKTGGPDKFRTKISITSQGVHSWYAPAIFHSMCKMDIRYFPFDEQQCDLRFGSWAYDTSKIDLEIDANETGINFDLYQDNNEWKIVSVTAEKRMKKYTCCKYKYADIRVTLRMKRRFYHYLINLVFPCAVIACMVFFTFVLPAESGERISLCITVLMAMTIFQELTSEKLPVSSDGFILIEMYYTAAIVAIALAMVATCIVLNFYYTKTEMPPWLRRLFLGRLARIIGIKPWKKKQRSLCTVPVDIDAGLDCQSEAVSLKSVNQLQLDRSETNCKDGSESDSAIKWTNGHLHQRSSSPVKQDSDHDCEPAEEKISARDMELIEEEWRTASRVLDRIFMIAGMILAVVSSTSIFLQAPRVRKMIMGEDDP